MTKPFIVGVDFDGTLAEHRFPYLGDPVPGAFEWCRKFQAAEARLILWTMRSDNFYCPESSTTVLRDAVVFCEDQGIAFWAVNDNPEQASWTTSRKVYMHTLIDDANAYCPLIYPGNGGRPMVDWSVVGPAVLKQIEEYSRRAQ